VIGAWPISSRKRGRSAFTSWCRPPTSIAPSRFDHLLYDLLDSEPNEWRDPLQFKETLAVH
jgi:hypothetical protein